MLLFSATFEDSVWKFAQKVVPDPNIIKLKREEETLDTIKQYYVLCSSREEKFQALCNIYGAITIAQAMIFCHVRAGPGRVGGRAGDTPAPSLPEPPRSLTLPSRRPARRPAGWRGSCPKKATRLPS